MGITQLSVQTTGPHSVHPHTRGDHGFWLRLCPTLIGSPPHAWGSQADLLGQLLDERFTPTRVGITLRQPLCRTYKAVHPHTRGDHRVDWLAEWATGGSPPHAWGSLDDWQTATQISRFTPTRVGITRFLLTPSAPPPVHPHTRGDHYCRTSA